MSWAYRGIGTLIWAAILTDTWDASFDPSEFVITFTGATDLDLLTARTLTLSDLTARTGRISAGVLGLWRICCRSDFDPSEFVITFTDGGREQIVTVTLDQITHASVDYTPGHRAGLQTVLSVDAIRSGDIRIMDDARVISLDLLKSWADADGMDIAAGGVRVSYTGALQAVALLSQINNHPDAVTLADFQNGGNAGKGISGVEWYYSGPLSHLGITTDVNGDGFIDELDVYKSDFNFDTWDGQTLPHRQFKTDKFEIFFNYEDVGYLFSLTDILMSMTPQMRISPSFMM